MNRTIQWTVAAITVIAIAVSAGILARAYFTPVDLEVARPDLEKNAPLLTTPPKEEPKHFLVPRIDIDAHIQYVGVNAKGNMATPSNFSDVAWYKYGTVPGQMGSAVIDGHVDNGLGLAGVFKRLGELEVGDDVYIETKEGRRLHFRVIRIADYHYLNVPVEELFNRADGTYLNLVTCEGNWIKGEKTYDQRLVVYTKLVDST